jgi:hypothetical protein
MNRDGYFSDLAINIRNNPYILNPNLVGRFDLYAPVDPAPSFEDIDTSLIWFPVGESHH